MLQAGHLRHFLLDKPLNYCLKIKLFLKIIVSLKRFENHE